MAFVAHYDVSGNPDFICSGAVVSTNVILTAAHCAIDETTGAVLDPSGFRAVTGAVDWTDTANRQVGHVSKVIVDPAYDPASATSDAALLVLFTPTTAPSLRLATTADDNLEQAGTGAVIAGWGAMYAGASLEYGLEWASTVVQSSAYCGQFQFSNFFYNPLLHLCSVNAPSYDTATCYGDSGGPLVTTDSTGRAVELGVTSVGPADCNTVSADYFTAVAPLSSWANNWISALAPAPPLPPPPPTPTTPTTPTSPAPPSTPPVSSPAPALSKPQLPSMALARGRSHVRDTLAGAFGTTFKRGHAYRASCSRKSSLRISCDVTFSSGPNDYYGTVTVYYVSYSKGTAYWSDTYNVRWVNDQCYFHSGHRRSCRTHTKHGTW
jgi:hypothetical protein